MVVAQVIPAVVRQAVAQARLITLVGGVLGRNRDVLAARDALVKAGTAKDQATLNTVQSNPDIKTAIINEAWDQL
jgi:hypothetical protein